jgi:hypothetical protein
MPEPRDETMNVLGGKMLTRGAANIADQLFGQRTGGGGENCAESREILGWR